jgi:hypothetical protein
MSEPHLDPFKRFQATVKTARQAQEFIDIFYRKFGSINGENYLCSESSIDRMRNDSYVTRLGFVPWPYPIDAADHMDFDRLIADSGAVVC